MEQTFTIQAEQVKKINDWIANHHKQYIGAIGGRYTYSFTPTTLGVVVKVTDAITGTELDVSDYEGW